MAWLDRWVPGWLTVFSLLGCGDHIGTDPFIDAAPAAIDATAPDAGCPVCADFGDVGMPRSGAWFYGQPPPLWWGAFLETECNRQLAAVHMALWEGRGIFEDGLIPGTYALEGRTIDPSVCDVCLNLEISGTSDDRCYFATGGTVVLESTEERLIGSLEDISFEVFSCSSYEPLGSPCASHIQSLTFNTEIVDQSLRCSHSQ